jgi:hypothetical protein
MVARIVTQNQLQKLHLVIISISVVVTCDLWKGGCDAIPLAARARDDVRHSRASLQLNRPPLRWTVVRKNSVPVAFLRSVGAPECECALLRGMAVRNKHMFKDIYTFVATYFI